MDEELFNDGLKNRIREVFENFEDATADEGWLALRKKYPEEKEDKKVLLWLWWAAGAAMLLLFTGLWFFDAPLKPKPVAYHHPTTKLLNHPDTNTAKNHPTEQNKADTAIVNSAVRQPYSNTAAAVRANRPNNNKQADALATTKVASTRITANNNAGTPQTSNSLIAANKAPVTGNQLNSNLVSNNVPSNIGSAGNYNGNAGQVAAQASAFKPSTSALDTFALKRYYTPLIVNANGLKPAAVGKDSTVTAANKTDEVTPTKHPDMMALLNNHQVSQNPEKRKPESKGNKPVISVYAATYFTYAIGSDNLVNLGAGVSSDFKLSNNLKLSTGLAIAQNTLNYSNGDPSNYRGGSLKADALSSSVATGATSAVNNLNSTVRVTHSYNASLVGLDVPLNLKYEFNPKKSDTFISAGLSSGTFINEQYVSTYNYFNVASASSLLATGASKTQEETIRKNFSSFDFAKTLNLSFGVGYQLGKNNRLIVEPFLKYPLAGLGAEQIKFGAGGINLKLNFQKKR